MEHPGDNLAGLVDPSSRETQLDLRFLEALRQAKKEFFDEIAERSNARDDGSLAKLLQESVYQISEFFYLLDAFGVDSEKKIRNYAELHNRHMTTLLEDELKMRRLGLRKDRVSWAMFSDENIMKVVANHAQKPPAFDQSDLARLLVQLMSQETCRATVVALADAGFLIRSRSAYQSVLVQSNGSLECIFAGQLRRLRRGQAHGTSHRHQRR